MQTLPFCSLGGAEPEGSGDADDEEDADDELSERWPWSLFTVFKYGINIYTVLYTV